MSSGSCRRLAELPTRSRRIMEECRRAVLSTIDARGRPHSVPICWAMFEGAVATPLDDKPKRGGELQRVRNIRRDGRATMLFDRWDEDWSRVGWVMLRGQARVEPPGTAAQALAARYPQYARSPPSGKVIVVSPDDVVWWTWW